MTQAPLQCVQSRLLYKAVVLHCMGDQVVGSETICDSPPPPNCVMGTQSPILGRLTSLDHYVADKFPALYYETDYTAGDHIIMSRKPLSAIHMKA